MLYLVFLGENDLVRKASFFFNPLIDVKIRLRKDIISSGEDV
jgi:hypothetical protein